MKPFPVLKDMKQTFLFIEVQNVRFLKNIQMFEKEQVEIFIFFLSKHVQNFL